MASALEITEEEYEDLLTEIRPATFVCLDSVRSAEQEGEATQHEAVADAAQPDPGRTTERRELARIIAKRLCSLPEMQRKVLALYYFEDLRLREIAEDVSRSLDPIPWHPDDRWEEWSARPRTQARRWARHLNVRP
jgi:RNA polymerase sigma factor for flagellar operon FliA